MMIDKADSSLNDCDRLGLGLRGFTVPFREAYRGTVDDVVKVNAKAARTILSRRRNADGSAGYSRIPCHRLPRDEDSATGTRICFVCIYVVIENQMM